MEIGSRRRYLRAQSNEKAAVVPTIAMTFARPLALVTLILTLTPAEAAAVKQVYKKPQVVRRGDYSDPYYGRQGGRICPRLCLQDRSPCDPPHFKTADRRCFEY